MWVVKSVEGYFMHLNSSREQNSVPRLRTAAVRKFYSVVKGLTENGFLSILKH